MKETQKMNLTNVWFECNSVLVSGAFNAKTFRECFVIGVTLVLITMEK